MTYHFNNQPKVTMYRYSIYSLYIVTILYLLRGKYTKLLYCVGYLLKDIDYLFSSFRHFRISLIYKSFTNYLLNL